MPDGPAESGSVPNPTGGDADEPSVGATPGFSATEKIIGVAAAYRNPLATGVVAGALLRGETNPERRGQLSALRKGALVWWAVSIGVAVVVFVIVLNAVTHTSGAGGPCKGGPDKFDALNITYQSDGNRHWTATYPCHAGGSTTIPVARDKVPGAGS